MSWDTPASQPSWDLPQSYQAPALRLASSQHRIAAMFLEPVLFVLTGGIGWIIWSLLSWKNGQSPAQRILKIRVFSFGSNQPVTWGHMAIYEFLFGFAVILACVLVNLMTFGILTLLPFFVFWVTDFCWYWKDGKKRTIRDNVVKVVVINIA
jgi:hypothetical protein